MLDQNSSAVECLPVAVSPSGQAGERRQGLALQIFDQIPPGYVAFRIADHGSEPLIKRGEVVIIDNEDNRPEDGALFLCRYTGGSQQSLRINETFTRDVRIVEDGRTVRQTAWFLGHHCRPRDSSAAESWLIAGRHGAFVDGPYLGYGEGARALRDILIGRVVGILSSDSNSGRAQ